ncbi:MAG TPA: homocysteine S-methyltransferase [Actinomycetes bacterium]|nr:homocysteine S-methyltransferase [Actinomycetes bacterium]
MTSLRERIRTGPVLLDGGLSTTLEGLGHDISGDLWSARLLRDDPAAILQAHRAFFAAGAEVATTATYQATFDGFAHHGIDNDETETLMRRGVQLAREAADSSGHPTWVAASAGPYGAMLADGSEYTGAYGFTVRELRNFHRPRLEVLAATDADVLAFETIPTATEVEAVLAEIDGTAIDCWLSVSITGDTTRAGEPLDDVFGMTRGVDELVAVGVNCSTPSDATAAVSRAAASGHPVVIYPNSGEGWDAVHRTWVAGSTTGNAEEWPVDEWVAAGARLVGGCCRIGPDQIAALGKHLH